MHYTKSHGMIIKYITFSFMGTLPMSVFTSAKLQNNYHVKRPFFSYYSLYCVSVSAKIVCKAILIAKTSFISILQLKLTAFPR